MLKLERMIKLVGILRGYGAGYGLSLAAAGSLGLALLVMLSLPGFMRLATAQAREVTLYVQVRDQTLSADCLECHEDEVDKVKFLNSVHGPNGCTSCHIDIFDIEKHEEGIYKPGPVACSRCHKKEYSEYMGSIHRVYNRFTCTECHNEIHFIQPWKQQKIRIIEKCTQCHEEEDYVASGHAQAILRGNNDSAVCSDCHGLHNTRILHTGADKYPVEARAFYTKTCKRCHSDEKLMKKNRLTTINVETYDSSYHGKVQKLGYPTHVAGCADCHTSHNILPVSDPKSTIYPANLVKNCGRCHPNANQNFVKFKPHADFRDRRKYPALFWTAVLMSTLLIGTMLFFWFHTILWWRKSYWEKHQLMARGIDVEGLSDAERRLLLSQPDKLEGGEGGNGD